MTSQQSELLAAAVASYRQRREQMARCWKLPNWEEYSDCALSDVVQGDNWSDVEADVSFETASWVSSNAADTRSTASLQELHSQYDRRREAAERVAEERFRAQRSEDHHEIQVREDHREAVTSTPKRLTPRKATTQSPAAAASSSPWRRPAKESALAAQNAVLNMQLLSVRKQLTDLQDRLAKQPAPTAKQATPFSDGDAANPKGVVKPEASSMAPLPPTELQNQLAVEKWISLITQKIELIAANGLFTPSSRDAKTSSSLLRGWHAGDSLQGLMLTQSTSDKFVQLERALTELMSSVDKYSQRQLTHFERSVRQIQGFHHERLQKVVDESLAEMKQIRGRYKKKQDVMEEELRTAAQTVDQWRQKGIEASQESVQLREAMKKSLPNKQFQEEIERAQNDLEVMERRLEMMQMEKEDMAKKYASAFEDRELKIHELKQIQKQYDMLQALHKDQIVILENERNDWKQKLEQSRLQNEKMAKKISDQTTFVEQLVKQHEQDRDSLQAQVKQDVETLFWKAIIPETLQTVQRDHAAELDALRKEWEAKVADLTETRATSTATDYRSVDTQTDQSRMLQPPSPHKDDARVEELKRRCRSLERLLNKKFEEGSMSDPLRTSYQSTQSLPSGKTSPMTLNTSRQSVLNKPNVEDRLDTSTHGSLDDTLYVDTSTRTHVDMWDTASFSSMDSLGPITPARERRPQTPRTPSTPGRSKSTADVLKLLQKLKRIESGNNNDDDEDEHEPEPEFLAKRKAYGKSRGSGRLTFSNRGNTTGSMYG